MTGGIVLGLDADLLASGVRAKIKWDYTRCPHAVVFGSTGSGKTYFTRLLLCRHYDRNTLTLPRRLYGNTNRRSVLLPCCSFSAA